MTETVTVCEPEMQKKETVSPQPRRVCFICTGNTCRSPMAAAVANALARENDTECLVAYSAGLYANAGDPIAANAVRALERADVAPVAGRDYHTHTAHTLLAEEAERYDLLVGMSGGHAMELLMRFPHLAQKITCMPHEISDPFGGDLQRYESCLAEIAAGVKELLFAGRES